MKSITIFFVLAAVASALSCTAQDAVTAHKRHGFPNSPELTARLAVDSEMERLGAKALHDGNFTAAEADFRRGIQASPWAPGYYGLGEALAGQGRIAEAIEAYRVGIYGPPYTGAVLNDIPVHGLFNPNVRDCAGAVAAEAWMKYALLLSQTGQGAEAVTIYKKALPRVPDASTLGLDVSLISGTLTPAEFQAAAHIALGLCATFSGDSAGGCHEKAMSEFDVARRLQPDSALTNYYYGYGWQQLDPKSPARRANAPQAKVAFQQAAAYGEGDVKKAAEQALTGFK